jgi:hypothetical protein
MGATSSGSSDRRYFQPGRVRARPGWSQVETEFEILTITITKAQARFLLSIFNDWKRHPMITPDNQSLRAQLRTFLS